MLHAKRALFPPRFVSKGMGVVAATSVVVDTLPPFETKGKEKFIGAPFPFSPSFIGRSPLLPFSLFTRRIFSEEAGVSRLVA